MGHWFCQLTQNSDIGCNSDAITSAAQVSCIEIGQSDSVINADKPIRIKLGGQAGNVPWYSEGDATATQITVACTADDLTSVSTQLEDTGECFINMDGNLIIWTTHFTTFGSNLVSPPPPVVVDPEPTPEPTPEPSPRRSGGGGGGGGSGGGGSGGSGGSSNSSSLDRGSPYDLSFIFTSNEANVLTGSSQITLESNTSLTITPNILPVDTRQKILKMEIIISDHTTPHQPAALIQYMLIPNILTHNICTGKEYTSDRLYICDFSSIISETQVSYLKSSLSTAKHFDGIVIPFEGDFSGSLTVFLQDNRGINLSSHTNTIYDIVVTSEEDYKPKPADEVNLESTHVNPESVPVNPEPTLPNLEPPQTDPRQTEPPQTDPRQTEPPQTDPRQQNHRKPRQNLQMIVMSLRRL